MRSSVQVNSSEVNYLLAQVNFRVCFTSIEVVGTKAMAGIHTVTVAEIDEYQLGF